MTTPSPDARAVVAAVDRLTTQAKRIADTLSTRGDAPTTTPDDGYDAAEKACPTPLTHNWGCGCPTDEAPAAHTQTLRWARRESLLVLLTRVQHGRTLTDDEARTLRHHVETEMREAEQLRARTDTMHAELKQAQAAIARVQQACHELPYEHARRVLAALDGTEQPTEQQPDENARLIAEYQAAILRVLALREPIAEALERADYRPDMRRGDLADAIMPVIHDAVSGTEQPTTEEN